MEFLIPIMIASVSASVLLFGFLGSWIAGQKGRDPAEGFCLGAFFGPLGCLIEALMPAIEAPPARPPTEKERADAAAYHALVVADRKRQQADLEAEVRAARKFAEARAERRRLWWAERDKAYRAKGVKPGPWAWFQVLPEWVQAVALGLAAPAPIIVAIVIWQTL
jgi:hypothetical protein